MLFTAGEIKDAASEQVFNLHVACRFTDSCFYSVFRQPHIFAGKGNFARCVHTEKLASWILKYAAHDTRGLIQFCFDDIHSADAYAALQLALVIMGNQPVDEARYSRFSAAGGAAEQHDFTCTYRKRNIY
ncbi:hypothetical protein SDC9_80832 [bioreactor metagenome]|uniref:Uncharacterized protein n=1 Tax=bioreactor metagenome TaxID=1076179 RepID=A0A644Z053_9ZZZZ